MKKPKLSVGVPVFNGQKYLHQALDCLLAQDMEDFELIISDNGSTDESEAICREYARRDRRIRYIRSEQNHGATWNFRRVFDLAEGTYFKWAAADDECYPTMFRRCLETLEAADPSVVLVYPRFEFIDEEGTVAFGTRWDHIQTSASLPCVRLAHVLFHCLYGVAEYGIYRTAVLRRTRPYASLAADWIKLAELSLYGRIVEVPEVLLRPRVHASNSDKINPSWRQLLLWHDPCHPGYSRWMTYDLAIISEYLKSISVTPLNQMNRLSCYVTACTVPPVRGSYIWFINRYRWLLRVTGPLRIGLRKKTGWAWLSHVAGGNHSGTHPH